MSLVRMSLGGYRCFARRQEIELRPVTLVLGRNNSGKSALVRAPLVLSTGIGTTSAAPLDLDQLGPDVVDSFTDLVFGNRARASIQLGAEVDGPAGPIELAATVQHIREHHTQVVSDLRLGTYEPFAAFRLEWELNDPRQVPRYTVKIGEESWDGVPIAFQGLLPHDITGSAKLSGGVPLEDVDELLTRSAALRESFPAVRYFGPFRDRPQRRYRLPGRMPTQIGAAGEHAAGILVTDKVRHSGELIGQLNEAFADHLPGWKLDVAERGGLWSVVLISREDETISVNLADAGTGVAQALPIFVQRGLDLLNRSNRPVLEIIEQPELHLHPGAHAALADLYLDAVRNTSTRFLIETHSETLLLRLRRRIAEGEKADPSTVAVYFVDRVDGASTLRQIHIDEAGNLDYWPEGVFSEDYQETKDLAREQLRRRDRQQHAR